MLKVGNDYNRCYDIYNVRIECGGGLKPAFPWQRKMLYCIVNNKSTYQSNQSHALYYNYTLKNNEKHGNFWYNIVLYDNGTVVLKNLSTGKNRKFHFSKKYNPHHRQYRTRSARPARHARSTLPLHSYYLRPRCVYQLFKN